MRWTLSPVVLLAIACEPILEQPEPSLQSVSPELICRDRGVTLVTVSGAGLTPAPLDTVAGPTRLALPQLSLTHESGPIGESVNGTPRLLGAEDAVAWHSSSQMTFEIGEDSGFEDGVYSLSVQNPSEEVAGLPSALLAVSAPVIEEVVPMLFCGEQEPVQVEIRGQNFLEVEGTAPTVSIGAFSMEGTADSCTDLVGPIQGRMCQMLRVTVPPDTLSPGLHAVAVANPAPDDCASTEEVLVEVLPAPFVEDVVPPQVCVDAEPVFTGVFGSGFLFLDADSPTVFVDEAPYAPDDRGDCAPLLGSVPGEVCKELYVTLDPEVLGLGSFDVYVVNPEPAACESDVPGTFDVVPPPEIETITPGKICDTGAIFTITGEYFSEGAQVLVGSIEADSVLWVDSSTLIATVSGPLPSGLQSVQVINPDECLDSVDAAVEVIQAPILFFTDPTVVWSGADIQASLYVAGVVGEITRVWLVEPTTGDTFDLTYEYDGEGIIRAVIPAGLEDGDYDVFADQDASCPFGLPGAITVASDLTIPIDEIDSSFAWTGANTPVRILATNPAPDGSELFEDVPRVYLNPVEGGTARALRSVSWRRADLLNAVVPEGLTPGDYDVIVVNPNGAIGVLEAGLRVTELPPPAIDSVAPATMPWSEVSDLLITGANFREPTVDLTCRNVDSGVIGAPITAAVDPDASDEVSIVAAFDPPGEPLVCTVTVTNDDGTWFEFAGVTVTNPAQNLFDWRSGPPLNVARRAPAAAAARATATARFAYTIGGDSGSDATAMASIEFSEVGKFGDLGPWVLHPEPLPAPRTRAAITQVGRFLYLIGGDDGGGPVDSVWRAQVLDPLASPEFDTLSLSYGEDSGLSDGIWSYRIAALFDDDDPLNPSGESLASDPIVVRLPDIEGDFHLNIAWTPVEGAAGYRVYRTPDAGTGSGTEIWLTDVDGTSVLDDGTLGGSAPDRLTPLPLGALGRWAPQASLAEPASSPCVATGRDPVERERYHIYLAGGDTGATRLSSVRRLNVDVVSDGEQVAGSWSTLGVSLSSARSECGGWTVDSRFHTVVDLEETWIYFGGGRTGSTTTSGTVQTGRIAAGGDLEEWTSVSAMTPTRAGMGLLSSGNHLYVFGGQGGSANANGNRSPISGPPGLELWANIGTTMNESRYLMGSAQESSVVFVVGGDVGGGTPTTSVDTTNF